MSNFSVNEKNRSSCVGVVAENDFKVVKISAFYFMIAPQWDHQMQHETYTLRFIAIMG